MVFILVPERVFLLALDPSLSSKNASSRTFSYELGRLRVEDTMNLTIPDYDLSLMCIVCSFILLLLLYFILPSFPLFIGLLVMIIISIYSWFFEPYLTIYPVIIEVMILFRHYIYEIPRRLRRILSELRKYRPKETDFEGAKHVVVKHLDISEGNIQAIPSDHSYDEILQRLLRSRIRLPPREYVLKLYLFPRKSKAN